MTGAVEAGTGKAAVGATGSDAGRTDRPGSDRQPSGGSRETGITLDQEVAREDIITGDES